MSDTMVVKVSRVLRGDNVSRPVASYGIVSGEVPEDGYLVSSDLPGALPLYVRDSDLEHANQKRNLKKRLIYVDAVSWEEKGDGHG